MLYEEMYQLIQILKRPGLNDGGKTKACSSLYTGERFKITIRYHAAGINCEPTSTSSPPISSTSQYPQLGLPYSHRIQAVGFFYKVSH